MARKEKEWRKVKSIPAMSQIVPFIMVNRTGAMNMVRDSFESSKVEKYIKEKQAEGMQNLSLMHVMIAAYIRIVAQRPALNRFIRGQRIWTRKNVEIALTIKKEMTLESPDTVVKVTLPKNATLRDVYEALNAEIVNYRNDPSGDFEDTVNILSRIPALVMKFVSIFSRPWTTSDLFPSSF